jgi:hypothetical protein
VSILPGNHFQHPIETPPPDPAPSHPGPTPNPSDDTPIPIEDILGEDLSTLYSAIDSIFDATISNSTISDLDITASPKLPLREKDMTPPIRSKNENVAQVAPPKPFPRTRSQTELKPTSEQSSREVNSNHGDGKKDRIFGVEELSMNYSKLQLEVQELKKELQISRELEGNVDVLGCSTHLPLAIGRVQLVA